MDKCEQDVPGISQSLGTAIFREPVILRRCELCSDKSASLRSACAIYANVGYKEGEKASLLPKDAVIICKPHRTCEADASMVTEP